jgi:hypothetical protein
VYRALHDQFMQDHASPSRRPRRTGSVPTERRPTKAPPSC